MPNNVCVFEELVFFGLWILDSGFRIPDSGFRIPDSGFRIPDSGFRIPDSGFRIPDSGFRIPDFAFRFRNPESGLGLPALPACPVSVTSLMNSWTAKSSAFLNEHGCLVGTSIILGHLRSEGLNIPRERVRKCLARIDPRDVRIRWAMTVSRRAYSVAGPNSLWHLDGPQC